MIRCLICESKAILTRDVAKGIALLVSLADSALPGAQEADTDTPTLGSHSLINGLAVLAHAHPRALRVAEDVAKYHFGGFRYLCLRCGSLFDEPGTEEASSPPSSRGDSALSPGRAGQPGAQPCPGQAHGLPLSAGREGHGAGGPGPPGVSSLPSAGRLFRS